MTKYSFSLVVLLFYTIPLLAQDLSEGFEAYTPNERIFQDWWLDWNCGGPCGIYCSDQFAANGDQSGYVPGDETTDAVLDLGNKIFGTWYLYFQMYIPTGKEGYWNLQGEVPVGAGQWIIGNVFFNQDGLSPGAGMIDDAPGSPITFDFPHEQWFDVWIEVDISSGISTATFFMEIDGNQVVPYGTPFTNSSGTSPTSLGGVNFFSLSPLTEYWIDNICFFDLPPWPNNRSGGCSVLGIIDRKATILELIQNPIGDRLQLQSELSIDSITIYNMMGQQIYKRAVRSTSLSLDASGWARGTYTLEALVNGERRILRFIK